MPARPPAARRARRGAAPKGARAHRAHACLVLILLGCSSPARAVIPRDATRLIVVTTDDWDATDGRLRRYVRDGAAWRADGTPVDVVVGRTGLAWGLGLHGDGAPDRRPGPVKAEGDGKSPAGVFLIQGAYGQDPAPPDGTRLPYARLTESWRCVDDPASERYNEVFDAAGAAETWTSAEDMLAPGPLYRWVVVVGHNDPPARPGKGSCIFLHVWSGPGSATAGCTAMPRERLEELMTWMAPDRTVMVALPASELRALRRRWGLPLTD